MNNELKNERSDRLAAAERLTGPDLISPVRALRPGGGVGIRKAYCKTAASTGATIVCYLDTDGTGEEITVTCTLIQATNLNACFPSLADGTMMPVWKDGDTWRSLWWFMGYEECGEGA